MQVRKRRVVKKTDTKFQTLIESLGEGLVFCDPEDVIIHANQRLAELSGYKLSELIGGKIADLLLPGEESDAFQQHTELRMRGVSEQYEIRLMRKDGTRFWAAFSATPIRDTQSKIIGSLAVITDITEKREAESRLRESEERFRIMADTAPVMVWASGIDAKCNYFNKVWLDFTGRKLEEELGDGWSEGVHVQDRAACFETYVNAFSARESFVMEYRMRRHDGVYRWVQDQGVPTYDAKGDFAGYIGSCIDVTDYRLAQEEIIHQREFLRQVLDTNPNLIFVKDENGKFVLANKAFANCYGLNPDQVVGMSDWELHPHKSEVTTYLRDDAAVFSNGGEIFEAEREMTWPVTGEKKIFHSLKRPLVIGDNGKKLLLSVAVDITRRKEAEEQKARLEKQLIQAQKMEAVGQLASGIAHDLNNSLAAVIGHLELLEKQLDSSSGLKRSVQIARSGCDRAVEYINQLLGFARQSKPNLRRIDLCQVIEDTLQFLEKLIGGSVKVSFIRPQMPVFAMADASQLQQVLTNLIINGQQAMPHGGRIEINIAARHIDNPTPNNVNSEPGNFWLLHVVDSGPGIAPEIIDKLFEPFFTTRSNSGGTGLGLAMAFWVMQGHGGWIEVDSKLGSGSRFSLVLPVDTTEDQFANTSSKAVTKLGHVLVIDDEQALVGLMQEFLGLSHIASTGFTQAEQALIWYQSNSQSVDLVILDLKMPHSRGSSVFEKIRKINPKAKVIVLTGYVDDHEAQELLVKGVKRFFKKPLSYTELVAWIKDNI